MSTGQTQELSPLTNRCSSGIGQWLERRAQDREILGWRSLRQWANSWPLPFQHASGLGCLLNKVAKFPDRKQLYKCRKLDRITKNCKVSFTEDTENFAASFCQPIRCAMDLEGISNPSLSYCQLTKNAVSNKPKLLHLEFRDSQFKG